LFSNLKIGDIYYSWRTNDRKIANESIVFYEKAVKLYEYLIQDRKNKVKDLERDLDYTDEDKQQTQSASKPSSEEVIDKSQLE
jgi:hypothetical protein